MDRATQPIKFVEKKQKVIAKELRRLLRIRSGVKFNELEQHLGKLWHAIIGIPEGYLLMGPIHRFMVFKPKNVF